MSEAHICDLIADSECLLNHGDQIKSPVLLRPKEECSFVDTSNCQFFFTNTSAYTIPQGSLVEVIRQRMEGAVLLNE